MKKIFAFFSIAAILASCTKEVPVGPNGQNPEGPDPAKLERVRIEGSVSVDSKATIGGMIWQDGDEITIWVKSAMGVQEYNGDQLSINPSDGKFSGEIVKPQNTDVLYVAYNASGCNKDNGPVFAIPAVQNKAAGGATQAMLKQDFQYNGGSLKNLSFTLSAATARLKITVSEPVTNVVFAGMNNEDITASSKTLTYSGTAAEDIEFVVPAMTFSNGYKITYTNSRGTMYQSYSGSKSFVAGTSRNINCDFAPFKIDVAFEQIPMSSYSYYEAAKQQGADVSACINNANSDNFLTTGEAGYSTSSGPSVYDEDAKGHFTGNIEGGTAKVVITGASTAVLPSLTVTERGYYVTYVMRASNSSNDYYIVKDQKVVVSTESVSLSKTITWSVCGENENGGANGHDFTLRNSDEDETPLGYAKFYAGEVKLNPYIVVAGTEYTMYPLNPTSGSGETVYITGMPHKSNHKDLWYVCQQKVQATQSDKYYVSGAVPRYNDDTSYPVDMFYINTDSHWDDFCVKSRGFSIPAGKTVNARPVMHGVLWGGINYILKNEMNAYFYYDAAEGLDGTDVKFVLHKNVTKNNDKITSSCDAKIELDNATSETYHDLTTENYVTLTNNDNKTHMNIYLWIYRGNLTGKVGDHPGYWCRYIKVQYAAPTL